MACDAWEGCGLWHLEGVGLPEGELAHGWRMPCATVKGQTMKLGWLQAVAGTFCDETSQLG